MAITAADLRAIEPFADLSDDALQPLAEASTELTLAPGDDLVGEGQEPLAVFVLLEGGIDGLVRAGGRVEVDKRHIAPTWVGAIGVLLDQPLGVTMRAATPCRVAVVEGEAFRRLLHEQRTAEISILQKMLSTVERVTTLSRQREKLAALGTMAAGLAHELNNPASAAKRAAEDLIATQETVEATLGAFTASGIERAQAAQLVELQRDAARRSCEIGERGALETADLEDELADAMDELGVAEAWAIAEPLAAAGVDADWIRRVAELAGPASDAALRWVAATLTARGLATDLRESSERISGLVSAVKEYAYMDRAEQSEVDLHDGLESTLKILGHKLKHSSIEITRDYDRSLPRVNAYGSELNQVWTNLLDNAIDALDGDGSLTVRTAVDGDRALVEIVDDGHGIPEHLRGRVFEPFFTTKDVGAGTGLGLETARRIVVDRHRGDLRLEDAPGGGTRAVVCLPLEAAGGAV